MESLLLFLVVAVGAYFLLRKFAKPKGERKLKPGESPPSRVPVTPRPQPGYGTGAKAIRRAEQAVKPKPTANPLEALPERFVVYDLETTGLDPDRHEIIEIGAIRVNRDSDQHDTFQTLVIPQGRISSRITEITGINRQMVKAEGRPLEEALPLFREFVGELPLVAFNAQFDDAFLAAACRRTATDRLANESCCALKMARRAWPGRSSYKLSALAKDGGMSLDEEHRALGDCRRTMIVYAAAAQQLGTHR